MSSLPNSLRLGAVLVISFAVMNMDGTPDSSATISNVDLHLENVVDSQGDAIDQALFATIEEIESNVDKVTITSDSQFEGASATFVGIANVKWPDPNDPDTSIEKEMKAVGHAVLSSDPSSGDTLEMVVTFQ